jgi:phage terminase large subunit-like protein
MTTTTRSAELPVPREALLELGLTEEQIVEAEESAPLTLAFQADEQEGAYFDVDRVRHALKALAEFRHTKGRWAGRRIVLNEGLDPWQIAWVIAPVFGWVYYDDESDAIVRIIRTVWFEVPRKNGKSLIASAIANVLLLADGEIGAEVYTAAGSLDQAKIVFGEAKKMFMTSAKARKKGRPLVAVIETFKGGVLRALSRIAEAAHGLNVHGGVIDEVHVHKSRDLVDAIETGTGARAQPLILFITTADEWAEDTIYAEKHVYTENCANRVVIDPSHFGVIWAATEDEDPFVDETLKAANPGCRAGASPSLKYLRKEAQKAKTTPTYFPTYCRLHLNRRMRDTRRLIDLKLWDRCGGMVDLAKLKGRKAWGGLDLAAVSDFTSWFMAVESTQTNFRGDPVELEFLWRFYIPEDRVDELARQLQVPLKQWIKDGYVKVTEGNVIDYEVIQKDVIADCRVVDMQRIGYDRMFAGQLVQNVDKELRGVEVVPVAQTFLGESSAIKEIQRLLGRLEFLTGGNPVARWMASVVEVKDDLQDNYKLVKPERATSQARIDGMSAAVNGIDQYVRRPIKKRRKVVAMGGG